ncbi:capsular biosynthesis protein [Lutimaribacter sp. EGI FJ00015]|uniref:Capsular biosynthesis protein n=1 Tax=Lutimaribacter degradans TaxID=2945989 RepID=A0ACC5ZRW9_9RHOB|nr:capsular biosynthesis protein [Lutimaribacter sp. EGI FJ00013]MCM2560791.1 capsular biosynthesis protein [Lutimaribacter sp. EGI FJ00013]MCO0612263.1 capsular biosynthesis protein [Lutimaribacter sp. EGI FJ00015]MCO0634616.1 capsular biosynthesis protein [Lutimaribacter sp. EGI FJ00014]
MSEGTPKNRVFLFLQGPHGPFFHRLGRMLRLTGAQVWRVGFNAGDRAFWFDPSTYIPFHEKAAAWADRFTALVAEKGVTDIVLYGDTRAIHATAIERAHALGVTVHVFEEGYLRPYWVTYERGGANGHSRLMRMTIAQMRKALAQSDMDTPVPPAHWGDMRQHIFYGALYHWFVMFRNGAYRNFRPHRDLPVTKEFRLYLRRLLLMPIHHLERRLATRRVRNGGFPYHLALLQLEHDSSFQMHSPFSTMTEFLELVIGDFAKGAPGHHHLVIKAHPLEDGRVPLRHEISRLARQAGVHDRVHYVRGGKLAQLLNDARSAVTVNSTAAQQVLWRGIPLKVFGTAVYAKPEFVSAQPLVRFFAQPARPDRKAYKDYRRYLLETSQVPGGFYSARGRRQLLRQVVDMMLSSEDPYDALESGTAAPRQHLRAVT